MPDPEVDGPLVRAWRTRRRRSRDNRLGKAAMMSCQMSVCVVVDGDGSVATANLLRAVFSCDGPTAEPSASIETADEIASVREVGDRVPTIALHAILDAGKPVTLRVAVFLTGRDVHGFRVRVLAVKRPCSTSRVVEATEVFLLRPSWVEGTDRRPHRMLGYRVDRWSDIRRCHRGRAGPVLRCRRRGSIRDVVTPRELW